MKSARKVLLPLLLIALNPSSAFACLAPPRDLYVWPEALVERSPSIALVEVIEWHVSGNGQESRGHVEYRMKVLERIKGETKDEVIVSGLRLWTREVFDRVKTGRPDFFPDYDSYLRDVDHDFDSHRALAFWRGGASRTEQWPDCEVHPVFIVGERYLIFEGPQHIRSYEAINSEDDVWLNFVRQEVKEPNSGWLERNFRLSARDVPQ